jgi:hypothetical protein
VAGVAVEILVQNKLNSAAVEALALMRTALRMIDEAEGPLDVGEHLDLAICRLEEFLNVAQGK